MIKKKFGKNSKIIDTRFSELKKRVLFVLIALIVFRIGSFIPIPGIDASILSKLLQHQQGTLVEMFNMFSGGALSRASIFALGIMPFISASIIIQILTLVYPKFIEIKKDGEVGRKKINAYTRYTTLVLAGLQSFCVSISLPNISGISHLVIHPNIYFYCTAVIGLVTGTVFLMWLGELITEKGIGNGISIIIFSGIVSSIPSAIKHTIEQVRQGSLSFLLFLLISVIIFLVTFFVIFIERSYRKITVNYARNYRSRHVYSEQNTHLPLKLNMAGVIPAIFASSIILFPVSLVSWFGGGHHWTWLMRISFYLQPTQPFYILFYVITITFFCFFYTGLVFNPRETADNLKKSGAFISGIRPGVQTAKYINKITLRLTLLGSIYMIFICLIPEFMRMFIGVPFYFGGTSLLIVVVVIIDFISQIQTYIMSTQYESLLKKSNLSF
ncbi:preprotein translocase subunit SecY [Buchnera aphidicola (Melaphis rhois)]|uniref:Protein translocase subunit SecY n=1 Tax=Buchnera aphidicola subsp. Melaphis rhois TaxID=118103 RepID=A0A4D6YCT5_BUCMH|nr:preprotein translocase subunit SecY [Buchnera aphidicola]QCI23460.1 preprotein translocase subunit SecY [Buchnera aphidicola (Melaphis rhois)]